MNDQPGTDLASVFRAEHGRVVASLARRFGDLDLAEDATGEALLVAAERWRTEGVPPNPGGWLTTVAANKALDRIRRERRRQDKYAEVARMDERRGDDPREPTGPVEDDRLRLVFTCCHPALAPENRVALTLRLLGGLTVAEIAAAFLVPETTMAQRITRSKQKIKAAHIPYRLPRTEDLPERLGAVLAVLYLIFNEGYLGTSGEAQRSELTSEAIRLARQLREMVAGTPGLGRPPEVDGLLALMLLTESRARGAGAGRCPGPARRAGPDPLGRLDDRRGSPTGPRLPGSRPARPLPGAGCDQRGPHRRPRRVDDRLVAGASLCSTSCWSSRRARWSP